MHDVVIAGGGPAGLAAAIQSARRGFRTLVLERSEGIPDKACGEGLMPRGAGELDRLGVRVPDDRCAPFRGIRYLQEDGTILEARFRGRPGVGIRRTALVEALREAADAAGAEVRRRSVVSARARGDVVDVETDAGHIEAHRCAAPRASRVFADPAPCASACGGISRSLPGQTWSKSIGRRVSRRM